MASLEGFGKRLKEERNRLGLTQEALGEVGGVKRIAQYLYERDQRWPTRKYLLKIAGAGVDLPYVLTGARLQSTPQRVAIDREVLWEIYSLVDELGRSDSGKVLDSTLRLTLFKTLCGLVENQNSANIDWKQIRRQLQAVG